MKNRKPKDRLDELESTVRAMLIEAEVDFESVKCYRKSIHIHLTDGAHENIESSIPANLDGKPIMLFINGIAVNRATDKDLFGDCQATLVDPARTRTTTRVAVAVIITTLIIAAAYIYRELSRPSCSPYCTGLDTFKPKAISISRIWHIRCRQRVGSWSSRSFW